MCKKIVDDSLVKIGDRIQRFRVYNAINQKEMANSLGITEEEYKKIESGKQWISCELLIIFERQFHVNCRYLLLGEETVYSAYLDRLIKLSPDKTEILDNIFRHLINLLEEL